MNGILLQREKRINELNKENERAIAELKKSLDMVKALSGLLPICASCKKIKGPQGKWERLESYIERHSEAEFTHGLCPECVKKI